jgi:peptidoglycan-associated lipoprotein
MAQPISKSSAETNLAIAALKLAEKDYYQALALYTKVYESKEDISYLPIMAECCLQIRDYTKAAKYYSTFLRKDKENKFQNLRYNYGLALKMNGDYEEAIPEFQSFMEAATDDKQKALAQLQIDGAQKAQTLAKDKTPKKMKLDDLGKPVNGASSEYGPVYSREGNLYFASFNTDKVIEVKDGDQEQYAKIYVADKSAKGFGKPAVMDEKINRQSYHSSSPSFSADGNRMYFTRQILKANQLIESKIFVSVGGDGNWGAANEVVGVNGEYLAKHPVVGELFGREVLFFSANIQGGEGGMDLYYATLKGDGVYGDPVSLGPKINTSADEVTPFYFDGTLYFSSDGHPSIGGLDIFYTIWNGQTWSEPVNMGLGFNSPQDDQYFNLDKEGYKGLFTSNRPGGSSIVSRTCCEDIYGFELDRIKATLVVGVFDNLKKPLKGASIALSKVVTEKVISEPENQTSKTGNRFDFPLELDKVYKIKATAPGYFPDSARVSTVGLKASKNFEQRFYLKPLPTTKPKEEPEYDTVALEQAIVLENILYDLDKDNIKTEAESDLQTVLEIMNKYPDIVIEMSSHTDYRGNDAYNQGLSQRRAESARRWLIQKGIAADRITAKGYGETQSQTVSEKMASEHLFMKQGDVLTTIYIDKLKTEEEKEIAHALNRRTEFKIVKGPTKIVIKRTQLRKKETPGKTPPNRNSNIAPVAKEKDTIIISELSSLHGRKNLKGLPIMIFDEREVDFGSVKKGDKREHTFSFINRGDTPLKISVITACDCTTTEYSRDEYLPGAKGVIKVTFDSKDKNEEETIDIDIILGNVEPDTHLPVVERIKYKFTLVK